MKNILKGVIDMKRYISSVADIRKAAEQGNADAQFNLGLMYFRVKASHRTMPRL
jgi:TPR repeat protein